MICLCIVKYGCDMCECVYVHVCGGGWGVCTSACVVNIGESLQTSLCDVVLYICTADAWY